MENQKFSPAFEHALNFILRPLISKAAMSMTH